MTEIEKKTCNCCNRIYASAEDFYNGTSRWRRCEKDNLWFNCSCQSTLMLKSGKYKWYSPTLAMSAKAVSVFNTLPSLNSLPRVPMAVMELQQALQVKDADVLDLVRHVKRDAFISANVLNIANNLKLSRSKGDLKKIESLEHAIIYIGKKTLEELVLTISLESFKCRTTVFNVDSFWRESYIVGNISEAIFQKFKSNLNLNLNRDELYISAVLCNLGKFVAAICFPRIADKLETDVNNPKTLSTWQAAEIKNKSVDHCVLGEIGSLMWGLPQYVLESAAEHHTMTKPSDNWGSAMTLVEAVGFANQVGHWILLRPSRIDQVYMEFICNKIGLSKLDLEDFVESLLPLAKAAS